MGHSEGDKGRKVPEIIQYFVKGELLPPAFTYVVPTGEPTHHQGKSTIEACNNASQSPLFFTSIMASISLTDNSQGMPAEAAQEQVSGASEEAPQAQPEKKEHKYEPPPMHPTWDAQR